MIDDFLNNFIQYDGITQRLPSHLEYFKCIAQPFFIELPPSSLPIYTLNKVVVRVHSCKVESEAQSWPIAIPSPVPVSSTLPISGELEVTVYYTTNDVVHSAHSTSCNFSLFELINYPNTYRSTTPVKPLLYVEDIFAYSLDSTHVYGHILLLATLPG